MLRRKEEALPGLSSGAELGVADILHTQCRMMAGV